MAEDSEKPKRRRKPTPTADDRAAARRAPLKRSRAAAPTRLPLDGSRPAPKPRRGSGQRAKPKAPRRRKPQRAAAEAAEGENLSLDPNDVEKPIKIIKAKGSKNIHTGIAHVLATFNNTIVTITDLQGNVIGWSSAGKVRLQRLAQEHRLRRADGRAGCLPPGHGPRPEGSRSPRQGPRRRPRIRRPRHPGDRPRNHRHQATSRRCRTTAAARRNSAASDRCSTLTYNSASSWHVTPVPKPKSAAASACHFSALRRPSNAKIIRPGMHGPKGSRRKQSEYAVALGEKQKLRYQYGLLERQFRRVFRDRAATSAASPARSSSSCSRRGSTTSSSASASRTTRSAARQLVSHGHVQVNGRKVNISSFNVKAGDEITVKDKPKSRQLALRNSS